MLKRLLWVALLAAGCGNAPPALTVSAAASLQRPIQELARAYESRTPRMRIVLNFGGSGMLAQQIEQGAPADVFFSAAPKPMDALESRGRLLAGTRRNLLRNQIVLAVPDGAPGPNSFEDLAEPRVKLIALGDPESVPAGDYGRQVLAALGLWDRVQSRLVLAKDVGQVLSYVETGNAEAGIVYATDARASHRVRIAAIAPEITHEPVVYPAAVLLESRAPAAARAFLDFLSSTEARAVFTRHGFTPVTQ